MFLQLVSSFKERKRIENEKSKEYKITKKKVIKTEYSGDHSAVVLPDSIPNSEVKCRNADGSVGIPHVRVGHRQIEFKRKRITPYRKVRGFYFYSYFPFPLSSLILFISSRRIDFSPL